MKLLLLNPPNLEETKVEAESIPFGLLHIKTFIMRHGFEVELLNLGNETQWTAIRERLLATDWDAVGISCYTTQRLSVYKLADLCKQIRPDATLVLGGPHATLLDTAILEHVPSVDYIIRNEGELTLLELMNHLKAGGRQPLDHIRGLTFRNCTRIIRNPSRPRIRNLSELPAPRYTLDDAKDFTLSKSLTFSFERFQEESRIAFIINSRGCSNTCLFCCNGTFWEDQTYYTPDYVFRQIQHFYHDLNIRMFDFSDDDFLHSKSYVSDLCDLIIESGIDIHWWCAGRAEHIDRHLLQKMKQAGCFMISYGFESGSPSVLTNIRKNIQVAEAVESARITKAAGLLVRCTMTVGNPGEDDATIDETVDFLRATRPDQIGLYIMRVYPGTPIYRRFKKEGAITDDYWFDAGQKDLPFYTSEHSIGAQIAMRDRIRSSLEPHIVNSYADDTFHIQHLFLRW